MGKHREEQQYQRYRQNHCQGLFLTPHIQCYPKEQERPRHGLVNLVAEPVKRVRDKKYMIEAKQDDEGVLSEPVKNQSCCEIKEIKADGVNEEKQRDRQMSTSAEIGNYLRNPFSITAILNSEFVIVDNVEE